MKLLSRPYEYLSRHLDALAVAAAVGLLIACGDAIFYGGFVWDGHLYHDGAAVIVAIKALGPGNSSEPDTGESVLLRMPLSKTRHSFRSELAHIHYTKGTGCDPNLTTYELDLNYGHSTKRYFSEDSNCWSQPDVTGYIQRQDVERLLGLRPQAYR